MADILATLGLDISGFKAAAAESINQARGFKKGFSDIKDVLAAGGVTAAVIGFFKTAIEYAKKSTDETDENAAAVRRWASAASEMYDDAARKTVVILGTFNRIGEAAGTWVRTLLDGRDAVNEAEESLKRAEAAERSYAESRAKHGVEFEQITKSLAKIEEQRLAFSQKQLSDQEQANALLNRMVEAQAIANDQSKSMIERRRAQLEYAQSEYALQQKSVEIAKQEGAAREKLAEAERKASLDRLTAAEKVVAVQKEIDDLQAAINSGFLEGANTVQLTAKLKERELELVQLESAAQKKADEDAKKAAEELARLYAEKAELTFKQQSLEEQINELARFEAEIRVEILRLKQAGLDPTSQEVQLLKVTNDLLKRREEQEKAISDHKREQLKLEDAARRAKLQVIKDSEGNIIGAEADLRNGSGASKDVLAAFGRRTYDNPIDQSIEEAVLTESAKRQIDATIAALEEEKRRVAQSNPANATARLAALEEQIRALYTRRSMVDRYVFDPSYQDSLGKGIIGNRLDEYADPGLQGRMEEQMKRQNLNLEAIKEQISRLMNP